MAITVTSCRINALAVYSNTVTSQRRRSISLQVSTNRLVNPKATLKSQNPIKITPKVSALKSSPEPEPEDQDDSYLDAVVKVYCTRSEPDYDQPWQNKQVKSRSRCTAFIISGEKLLTTAHCVQHNTKVIVKKRGDNTNYVAKVLAQGMDCDIALLSVKNKKFWEGTKPLKFGHLPHIQDPVSVAGYPFGEKTLSVTKGVVSGIEVKSHGPGLTKLLGIQIDAEINRGSIGGPALNDKGECIGMVFQSQNIGYLVPAMVVSHFLYDYERNGKYIGFPSLGILWQELDNLALRAFLELPYNMKGVLVVDVEHTSDANNVLKKRDVIVSIDNVDVGSKETVPFQSNEHIAFDYLISQKFAGDIVELSIIRSGAFMKVQTTLSSPSHLVKYHMEWGQPSYLIVAGLVFTPLREPLIWEEWEANINLESEQIVILSEVLAHEVNNGYTDRLNEDVDYFNGTFIKNIHHLAHLVDSCKDKYLVFEFENKHIVVLERETSFAATSCILKDYGIPFERSSNLLKPYVEPVGEK